jgi:hypothetical protein
MRDILTDEQRKAGKNRPLGLMGYLPDAALESLDALLKMSNGMYRAEYKIGPFV